MQPGCTKARSLPKDQFKQEVEKERRGGSRTQWEKNLLVVEGEGGGEMRDNVTSVRFY